MCERMTGGVCNHCIIVILLFAFPSIYISLYIKFLPTNGGVLINKINKINIINIINKINKINKQVGGVGVGVELHMN
jgi:hypothetical protein